MNTADTRMAKVEATGPVTVRLWIDQQKYLSPQARKPDMHALLRVQVGGTAGGGGQSPVLAQILAVDCSSSMNSPPEKFHAAKEAAVAALRMLPDGTPFAVVRGTESAAMVYPDTETTATADDLQRAEAENAVRRLVVGGGTCVGAWLDLSRRLLAERDAPIGHVLLLTDGRNQHDERMPLSDVLEACAGRFVCDAWGIGDGWDARELLRITRRLHGSAGAVREESALPGEYQTLMRGLVTKTVPELVISVTPMPGVQVCYLKQVHPTEVQLLPDSAEGDNERDGGTLRFVTRAWGDETRAYQLCLSADPADRPRGEDLQLAVVALDVPGGEDVRLPPLRPCVVHWTDNQALSDMTDVGVEYFERHHRLGQVVEFATDAFRRGERDQSEQWLGEAVRLAHEMGATPMLDRLGGVVEIIDAEAGQVRLRPDMTAADFEGMIIVSSHSTYDPTSPSDGETNTVGPTGATTACPKCQRKEPATERFCRFCGQALREGP